MKKLLNEREVNQIMEILEGEQRKFLEHHIKQSKRSKWLEMLGARKGIVIDENMDLDEIARRVNDWVLLDILDGGYGNRPYRCECGNSLRFQYIVHHTGRNKTYRLGSTCFEGYTSLSPEILKDIKNGFYHIDLQRDEILTKYRDNEFFDITPFIEAGLPNNILQQFMVGLPLTDIQVKRVLSLYKDYELHEAEKKSQEKYRYRMECLSSAQREWLKTNLTEEEISEILDKFEYEKTEYSLDYLRTAGVKTNIIYQLELGLPVTAMQELQIHARLRQYQKEQKAWEPSYYYGEERLNDIKETISYEELIFKYGEKIRMIEEREDRINDSLTKDWVEMKEMLEALKNNRSFHYKHFYLKLNNLLTSLGIY